MLRGVASVFVSCTSTPTLHEAGEFGPSVSVYLTRARNPSGSLYASVNTFPAAMLAVRFDSPNSRELTPSTRYHHHCWKSWSVVSPPATRIAAVPPVVLVRTTAPMVLAGGRLNDESPC